MRIAIVIPGFQSSSDDWCIPVFTNLAREMSRVVKLHVFALRYPHRRDGYRIGNIHVHSFGGGARHALRAPGLSLLNLWRDVLFNIQRQHRLTPFDAIMGIWATESGWLATRAANMLGVPSLVHLAGGELTYIKQIGYGNRHPSLSDQLVRRSISHADLLTVPSGPMKRALLQRANGKVVSQWAPGVNTEMFHPLPTTGNGNDQSFEFISVGSLIPVKGHHLLLRAMSELRLMMPERRVTLRILGDGRLRPSLEKLSLELNLQGYVIFEGDVSHDALPDFYNNASAFLLGSWHESQCMAALEAMACGLPWVGPPVGALADIAATDTGAQSGFLFKSRDPIEVAAAMKTLVELPEAARFELANKARRIVLSRYEMRQQTVALVETLRRLTDR